MKFCIAQTKPVKGDIRKNAEHHMKLIDQAVSSGAELVWFPELSLTGYEPRLAKELTDTIDDVILKCFQKLSDAGNITIGVGMPTKQDSSVLISMAIFQPMQQRVIYSKQLLHDDELPYFIEGNHQVILTIDHKLMAPAICYESLQQEHSEEAFKQGATFYLASVAKSAKGIAKAYKHYPTIAKKYGMTVLMANSVGPCDDFESVGQSGIWNNRGELLGHLNDTEVGILVYDTSSEHLIKVYHETGH